MTAVSVQLSAAIMTHPARAPQAWRIVERFREWDVQIALDPTPEAGPATLRTARAACRLTRPDATHHVVLQDDVVLQAGFFEHVRDAVARHPRRALAFFTEWGSCTSFALRIAALGGASWAEVVDPYVPMQAVVLPARAALTFDAYAVALPPERPDDEALHDHLRDLGLEAYVSIPNLVQHADTASLVGNQETMGLRLATCFSPELAEAGVPDGPVLDGLTHLPYYSWWHGWAECRVREHAGVTAWRRDRIRQWLDAIGAPVPPLEAAAQDALQGLGRAAPLGDRVTDRELVDLWLTAFGLGVAARADGAVPVEASPAAVLALRSLAPGALRLVVPPAHQDAVAECLFPLVLHALRMGGQHG